MSDVMQSGMLCGMARQRRAQLKTEDRMRLAVSLAIPHRAPSWERTIDSAGTSLIPATYTGGTVAGTSARHSNTIDTDSALTHLRSLAIGIVVFTRVSKLTPFGKYSVI